MKKLILSNSTEIEITDFAFDFSTVFISDKSKLQEVYDLLTDENLEKVTVVEVTDDTTTELGIFINRHCTQAIYDGSTVCFTFEALSADNARIKALESAIDGLLMLQLDEEEV